MEVTPSDPVPPDVVASDGPLLARWLADRDEPCPLCGYNLRDLTGDRCPECGQLLRLGIALAEPFLKAWAALLVAVLLPAGFGLLMLVGIGYGVAYSVSHGRGPGLVSEIGNMPIGPLLVLIHLIGCVPASVAVVAFRRRFLRVRRHVQRAVAAAAWLAVVGSLAYVVARILF